MCVVVTHDVRRALSPEAAGAEDCQPERVTSEGADARVQGRNVYVDGPGAGVHLSDT